VFRYCMGATREVSGLGVVKAASSAGTVIAKLNDRCLMQENDGRDLLKILTRTKSEPHEVVVWRRVQMQSADGEGDDVSFATKTHRTCCI
jgi:hypothetical protein